MTSVEELHQQVEQDVKEGLEQFLEPLGFWIVRPFDAVDALVDGDFAAVQWIFEGFDCCGGLNGMWPTGKSVLVRGLTLVDARRDEWRFSRHVDWNSVNSQLGGSRGRATTSTRYENAKHALQHAVERRDARQAEIEKRRAAGAGGTA